MLIIFRMNEHLDLLRRLVNAGVMYVPRKNEASLCALVRLGYAMTAPGTRMYAASDAGHAFVAGVDHVMRAM